MIPLLQKHENVSYEKSLAVSHEIDTPLGLSDLQLWQEFRLGNENAYAMLYKRNVSSLFNYGLRIVNNSSLIKDCIQDLFIEIWNNREHLSDVKFIKSYLYTAIRRKIVSESKQKKYRTESLNNEHLSNITPSESAEIKLIEKQNFDTQTIRLNKALGKLTQKQREVIHLKYNAQLSYEEIMHVMGITKKASYKLVDRALKALRAYM